MSIGPILTLGLGSFSDINHLPTLGYSSGAAPTIVTGGDLFLSFEWIWHIWRVP